ncbi:hypothetical protein QYF61_018191 [Mycteria americana]|uniref:Reverse transcriptase n=1 Tax=Mycteria americana TaxID=33587 RepID=A0AAN7N817_MYCAM|nr:hypothetical protein QYF61_018191 [Mycteria americana]
MRELWTSSTLIFSMVFDMVSNNTLVDKLARFGLERWTTRWSDWQLVTSGVPQRLILGLVLFNIFINDLYDSIENTLTKLADDTKLGGENNPKQQYRLGSNWLGWNSAVKYLGILVGSKLNMRQQCALVTMKANQSLKGSYREDGGTPFIRMCGDRTRGNGHKLLQGQFHLDIRKFFTMKTIKHWNRLSREEVESPLLEIIKTWLDRALDNLI